MMSGKMVNKIRIVKCPKCRQLLPEPQGYDVYKCGGCGTDLQAKKQSLVVNIESGIQELDAASLENALDLASEHKRCSNRKHQVPQRKGSLKAEATASSRECYLDGNHEYNGGQLVPFKFSDEEQESELDIYKLSHRKNRVSNRGGSNKIHHCEIEEIGNNEDLPLERQKRELICSSDEDDNDDRLSLIEDIPQMEVTETNFGNLSLEGADEELISGSDEEDADKEKSVTAGANHEMETLVSDLEDLNIDSLPLEELNSGIGGEDAENDKPEGVEEKLSVCAPDKEDPNSEQTSIEDTKSKIDTTEDTSAKNTITGNVDTLDTTELRDHSSEFTGVLGKEKLSKSPTNRSSYTTDSLKNASTVAEGRTRKGKGLANTSLYGDLGTQHQSHMLHEKIDVMKESRKSQNKGLDSTRHGNSCWMKTKRDHEFPSTFHRSGHQSCYESGGPSKGMHDNSSSFLSNEYRGNTDQEKMKLLRMIYELQAQLNKTRYMSEETKGREPTRAPYKRNHSSAYHGHDLHEGRFSRALDHSRCNGRCNHGIMLRQRNKYSRIPYSAEATRCAHHGDYSCYTCFPHVSADSSPHVHFQHEDLYRSYRGKDYFSSGPQSFASTKLPLYGTEPYSEDQRRRATVVRKYLREKPNLAKRHHKPVAGGAPFVTCHKCLKLLQLPADFLLFKSECHQLKCGECSVILKFSLKNGNHVVPFSSNTIGLLPSSELHEQSKVISGSNLTSKTHVNYYHYAPAKPISYYDDYGLSVSQSFSSEVDPVFLTQQFHSSNGGEYVNPNVSPSSTFREKINSGHSSTTKAPMETDKSAEFSSTMFEFRTLSAAKKAVPQLKASLHKLMGYSTPSQVIRGTS